MSLSTLRGHDENFCHRKRAIRSNTSFFLYPELSSIARKTFALREPLLKALQPYEDDIDQALRAELSNRCKPLRWGVLRTPPPYEKP